MSEFDFQFEEIPLSLGKDKSGKRQSIALITGHATVEATGRYRDTEREIVSVELETPIHGDAHSTTIEYGHPLFDFVVESIEWTCGDRIWDDALEAQREFAS
jgi:hypothetical protein